MGISLSKQLIKAAKGSVSLVNSQSTTPSKYHHQQSIIKLAQQKMLAQ